MTRSKRVAARPWAWDEIIRPALASVERKTGIWIIPRSGPVLDALESIERRIERRFARRALAAKGRP